MKLFRQVNDDRGGSKLDHLETTYRKRLAAWQAARQTVAEIRDQDESRTERMRRQVQAQKLQAVGAQVLPGESGRTAVAKKSAKDAERPGQDEKEARKALDSAQAALAALAQAAIEARPPAARLDEERNSQRQVIDRLAPGLP